MRWIGERVWQMGVGVVIILLSAGLVYRGAAGEMVGRGLMWFGLVLIFAGFLIPLLTRLFEHVQEAQGEEGET